MLGIVIQLFIPVLTEYEVLGSDLHNCKVVPQRWPFPFYSHADVNYLLAFSTGTGILLCNEAKGLCYSGEGGDWKTINFFKRSPLTKSFSVSLGKNHFIMGGYQKDDESEIMDIISRS